MKLNTTYQSGRNNNKAIWIGYDYDYKCQVWKSGHSFLFIYIFYSYETGSFQDYECTINGNSFLFIQINKQIGIKKFKKNCLKLSCLKRHTLNV